MRVHTYPEVLFRGVNLTSNGGNCNPDKAPVERHISFGSASNILGDPEEVCLNLFTLLWLLDLGMQAPGTCCKYTMHPLRLWSTLVCEAGHLDTDMTLC